MRFSERMGFMQPKMLQIDTMDADLRNGLWNVCLEVLPAKIIRDSTNYHYMWKNFLKIPVDDLPSYESECKDQLKKIFFSRNYLFVYDFIEFMANEYAALEGKFDSVLISERSAFRFINGTLNRITDETEFEAVIDATNLPDLYAGDRAHVRAAVTLFGRRGTPDYRNVIKEAISAVESVAKIISGNERATLPDAIKSIEKSRGMHPAFKDGISKIYGWTSDERGIRHALLEKDAAVDEADAHFMLVACAGFVNFLVAKYGITAAS